MSSLRRELESGNPESETEYVCVFVNVSVCQCERERVSGHAVILISSPAP